jgi:hypothetical protein
MPVGASGKRRNSVDFRELVGVQSFKTSLGIPLHGIALGPLELTDSSHEESLYVRS